MFIICLVLFILTKSLLDLQFGNSRVIVKVSNCRSSFWRRDAGDASARFERTNNRKDNSHCLRYWCPAGSQWTFQSATDCKSKNYGYFRSYFTLAGQVPRNLNKSLKLSYFEYLNAIYIRVFRKHFFRRS